MKFNRTKWVYWPDLNEELKNNTFFLDGVVLNAGCGIRDIDLPKAKKVVNMDIEENHRTHVVGNLESIPFGDNYFDGIINIAVLEHCRRPWVVVSEFSRVLRKGGKLICAVPFLQPIHKYPGDYFRMTPDGIESLLADFNFEIKEIQYTHSFFHILGWLFEEIFESRKFLSLIVLPFALITFLLSKYLKFNKNSMPCVITVLAIKR